MTLSKKIYLFISFFVCFVAALISCATKESEQVEERPNVILILADDMGIGDLSSFNGDLNKTPVLDSLMQQSIYFNNAYAGSPVCLPSRAALLTGRYPHRTGSVSLNMRRYPKLTRLAKDEVTIADIFQNNGYQTGLIGKWHSGLGDEYHPLKRGFKEYAGFNKAPDIVSYFDYQLDIQGEYHSFSDKYLTEHFTQLAIDFVRKFREESFFLHLAHYAPHWPLSAPKGLIQNYIDQGLDENTATIYAMIEVMDRGIGELVTELKELGIDDETLLIFTSDNGPDPTSGDRFNVDMKGSKFTINEGGIHVPFFIRWPGNIEPGSKDEIIHFTDVLPTLADILSLEVPAGLKWDGGSFKDILFDENAENKLPKQRYWQWNRGVPLYSHNAAIREGDWKLVRPFITRDVPDDQSTIAPRLYNIAEDPSETNDLSEDEEYLQRYDRMRVLLRQWSREMETERLKIDN